jgi:hypothetical protein
MTVGDDFFAAVGRPCPLGEGTRIRLVLMTDDPDPIAPGAEGTVIGGNGAQIYVQWDDGRGLSLIVGKDRYEVVSLD